MAATKKYHRVLLKLSGGSLFDFNGIAQPKEALAKIVEEIQSIHKDKAEIVVVLGGGNICRGRDIIKSGAHRLTADNVGMLATVMNALVFKDVLENAGMQARLYCAFSVASMVNVFDPQRALDDLQKGRIVICCGGTGNPLVSTDTAASLRAIQLNVDAIFKITNVSGVYTADPNKDEAAKLYQEISFDQVLQDGLKIMDAEAFRYCYMFKLPIHIAHYQEKNVLAGLIQGKAIGTKIHPGTEV